MGMILRWLLEGRDAASVCVFILAILFGFFGPSSTVNGEEYDHHDPIAPDIDLGGSSDDSVTTPREARYPTSRASGRDLVVPTGSERKITARTYQIDNLIVEEGAILRVYPNQRQWLILDVSGDATINGKIIYESMRPVEGPIEAVAPDGTVLSFSYPTSASGGRGGNAGSCGPERVGLGAHGSATYGGGGGGGNLGQAFNLNKPGINASGYRGGELQAPGGDGGRASNSHSGGLLYLRVRGHLTSESGQIFLNGANGPDGAEGADRECRINFGFGSGGGGGGAPGGNGGYALVVAPMIDGFIDYHVQGGEGGRPGRGGFHGRNVSGANGFPGRGGDNGVSGYVDELIK